MAVRGKVSPDQSNNELESEVITRKKDAGKSFPAAGVWGRTHELCSEDPLWGSV